MSNSILQNRSTVLNSITDDDQVSFKNLFKNVIHEKHIEEYYEKFKTSEK